MKVTKHQQKDMTILCLSFPNKAVFATLAVISHKKIFFCPIEIKTELILWKKKKRWLKS